MGSASQIAQTTRGRYSVTPRTLIFVTHGDDVLLVRGAAHKGWWAGRLNGVGGHIERDEDVMSSAWRELGEETGLTDVADFHLAGIINAALGDGPQGILLFVFTGRSATRAMRDTDEGTLEWIRRDDLANQPVLEDLRVLLPRTLDHAPTAPPWFAQYEVTETGTMRVQFVGEPAIDIAFTTSGS